MKEEFSKDMESLRKKKQQSNRKPGNKKFLNSKNRVEKHSSRLKKVKGNISELKDKIDIKEKNGRIFRKKDSRAVKGICKNCNSFKRPNL
jgi:hypothetical protein